MGIFNFKNFKVINEKAGVADATLFYVDPISNKVWDEFLNYYQSDNSEKLEKNITITYNKIRPNITDKVTYSLFPVVSIELNVLFKKLSTNEFSKKYKYNIERRKKLGEKLTHTVGGFAVNFGHRNWSGYSRMTNPVRKASDHGLIIYCGVSIDLSPSFNINDSNSKNRIKDQIEETIWHELNHLYEYYNRVLSGSGSISSRGPSSSITSADVNKWGIPTDIYNFWTYGFTYYLYTSEPHELNAQVQEAGYSTNKYGFSKLQKTDPWKTAIHMQNFNAKSFITGLEEEINKYLLSKGEKELNNNSARPIKERLKNMWIQQYEKFLKEYGEEPTIPLSVLKKMNCDQFAEYFQKRINDAGIYLKKKLSKLYIISPNDEEI